MGRWMKGEAEIEQLLESRHLDQVVVDETSATRLLDTAKRHIASATTTCDSDPEGALTLAYDSARKAAAALLAYQGLRATSAGGHIAVVAAMRGQFGDLPGIKSIDRLRRRRNETEYPDPENFSPVTNDEVRDAIQIANDCVETAQKLLASGRLGRF